MASKRRQWPKAANQARQTALHNLAEIERLADQADRFAEDGNRSAVRINQARIARLAIEARAELRDARTEEE